MGRFDGQVVFITGIARGQGRSHALRLAREGAAIVGLDLCGPLESSSYEASTAADLAETVRQVEEVGGEIVARVGDVRSLDDVEATVSAGVERFGALHHVVANAAVCSYGLLWELTPTQWQETLDVNLTGVWHTLRATVPRLLEAEGNRAVVVVSSGAGLKGLPLLGHYGATKWGVTGLSRTLAQEVAPYGIRVNSVHPTAVRTPMGYDPELPAVLADHPDAARAFGNMLPVGRIDPEDVTEAVVWLLSPEARWVTAVALPVDAGASQL